MQSVERVFFSSAARGDIISIWRYIAAADKDSADRLLDRFDQAIELLQQNPAMGRLRSDLGTGVRAFPVRRYVIFYRPTPQAIMILRLVHTAQDLEGLFFEDEQAQ